MSQWPNDEMTHYGDRQVMVIHGSPTASQHGKHQGVYRL